MKKNDLRTPLAKARGLGSAKDGVGHWWWQRVTAVLLIPLTLWFVYSLLSQVINGDHESTVMWLSAPVPALLMVLMVVSLFYHAKLGVQVIIEDYVNAECLKIFLLLLNSFLMVAMALVCLFAIIKVHFLDVISTI